MTNATNRDTGRLFAQRLFQFDFLGRRLFPTYSFRRVRQYQKAVDRWNLENDGYDR